VYAGKREERVLGKGEEKMNLRERESM